MATTNTQGNKVTIETDIPESFKPGLNKLQELSENLSRSSERGIINEKSGASIVARDNGQVNLSSNEYTQYKLNPDGKAIEQSIESVTITNRKNIHADEIVVNEHKLNPQLYELTNFKQVLNNPQSAVGNFCVMGTVLVKCWEPNLKRYVMIRRQVRMPMFSPILNVPEIPTALGIGDPLKETQALQVVMAGGYQVNGVIADAKATTAASTTTSDNSKKATEVTDKAGAVVDEKAAKEAADKAAAEKAKTPDKAINYGDEDSHSVTKLKEEIRLAQVSAQAYAAAYNVSLEKVAKITKDLEAAQSALAVAQLEADKVELRNKIDALTKDKEAAMIEKQANYDKHISEGARARELFDKMTFGVK